MAVRIERKYDLLVVGAAGKLGHEVLMHVQTFLQRDLKWAVVGAVEEIDELQAVVRNSRMMNPLPGTCRLLSGRFG